MATKKKAKTKTKTKAMSKSALIGHLADTNEMTRKDVVSFMECLVNTAYKEAIKTGGFR